MASFALLYAGLSYLVFLAAFLYAVAFVGDFIVPKSIDGPPVPADWSAWVVDTVVLGLFAVQHSVMARPAFKRWWTRFVAPSIERSTYVLAASLLLILVFVAWRPIDRVLWSVDGSGALAAWILYAIGWTIVLASTFMISHFELFGLTQAWRAFRQRPTPEGSFTVAFLYRFVRHPIMLGFVIAFWATPVMTVGHLLFAVLTTAYIFIGIALEEHDLLQHFGQAYADYRARVPMLLPFGKRAGNGDRGPMAEPDR